MRPTRNEGMSVPPNPTAADPVPGSMVRSAVSTTPGDHEPLRGSTPMVAEDN